MIHIIIFSWNNISVLLYLINCPIIIYGQMNVRIAFQRLRERVPTEMKSRINCHLLGPTLY